MAAFDSQSHLEVQDFIVKTLGITSSQELLDFFTEHVKRIGYEHLALFILADNNKFTKNVEDGLQFHTFPKEWIDFYREKKYLDVDPMVELSRMTPRPFKWWLDRADDPRLSEEQRQLVHDMREHGFQAGLVVPIFLPGGRIIHCAMASKKNKMDISPEEMIEIGYICHQVYTRFHELNKSETASNVITLSPRESAVLHWVAVGKSNPVIADILGISPHTVDTLMRRCFKKLGVANRTSAVLKAVSSGLISP